MESRRSFLQKTFVGVALLSLGNACKRSVQKIVLKMTGTKYTLGHRLWTKDFPKTSSEEKFKYVIVGAGISGLSAARYLKRKGISDFLLVELDEHIGGNSSNGENQYSKYPRGAHYLPLPNMEDADLITFLQEEKIIVSMKDGIPVFDEKQLSFPPQERLFYRGNWQEDLVPKNENDSQSNKEFERFFDLMKAFRLKKDNVGLYWFDLPISKASKVDEVVSLDKISMKEWLSQNNFVTEELFWYVNYCCNDDYGMGIDSISAWAGIHYFAGRKQQDYKSNYKNNVLTWPEGNAHLVKLLGRYSDGHTRKNTIFFNIDFDKDNTVQLSVYDDALKKSINLVCEKIILATPQFVNQYIFPNRKKISSAFTYAPWIVAAITLTGDLNGDTYPLAWDNVIYGSTGLGYVYDQQQDIKQINDVKVISYYLPFPDKDVVKSRKKLYRQSAEYWKSAIINDLAKVHIGIEDTVMEIEIFKLGHGMISPVTGFRTSKERDAASKSFDNKVFFAHTDLSGISVFEEGFYQGIKAAKEMLNE